MATVCSWRCYGDIFSAWTCAEHNEDGLKRQRTMFSQGGAFVLRQTRRENSSQPVSQIPLGNDLRKAPIRAPSLPGRASGQRCRSPEGTRRVKNPSISPSNMIANGLRRRRVGLRPRHPDDISPMSAASKLRP